MSTSKQVKHDKDLKLSGADVHGLKISPDFSNEAGLMTKSIPFSKAPEFVLE